VSGPPPRCSDLSELAGEPLGGTATPARHWLLVEVAGTWPRDVSGGEGLPAAARRAAQAWLQRTPSSRLLFIRRPGETRARAGVAFLVHGDRATRTVRRLELADLDERVDLDEAGGETGVQLVLVCGHGTRDTCCAQRGTAVYAALIERLNAEGVWISSHQGGHRFAGNVLVLPAGIHLGRLTAANAHDVVARALDGRVDLRHLRGQTLYDRPAQAADIAIRLDAGLDGLDDLELVGSEGERVRFRDRSGREHVAVVERRVGPVVPASCGADPEPQPVFTARVA
jgi:hypothetical protein